MKINTRLRRPGFYFHYFILVFAENSLEYDALHYCLVWLRTGSNLADINRLKAPQPLIHFPFKEGGSL